MIISGVARSGSRMDRFVRDGGKQERSIRMIREKGGSMPWASGEI
jgi:hypothetical protein